jgi:hypothetical protein
MPGIAAQALPVLALLAPACSPPTFLRLQLLAVAAIPRGRCREKRALRDFFRQTRAVGVIVSCGRTSASSTHWQKPQDRFVVFRASDRKALPGLRS